MVKYIENVYDLRGFALTVDGQSESCFDKSNFVFGATQIVSFVFDAQ